MINISGVSEEDMLIFLENLDNRVLMQRAMARVRQLKAAEAARRLGGQRVLRDSGGSIAAAPVANIDSSYYFARMWEEREHNEARMQSGENVWDDPEFLDFELKHNEALRPIVDRTGAPVFFGGGNSNNSETFNKGADATGGTIVAAGKYTKI